MLTTLHTGPTRNASLMPDHVEASSRRAVIAGAEPQLLVADISVSCDFYKSKLGFDVAFVHGEPPFYAQVKRDGARINLRGVDQPLIDPVRRAREELLSASFTVAHPEDIKALFLEFEGAGAEFLQPLKREPWGARDFIVRDPDGNLLLFAGPAE